MHDVIFVSAHYRHGTLCQAVALWTKSEQETTKKKQQRQWTFKSSVDPHSLDRLSKVLATVPSNPIPT
jgi:hypothetical protein